jgi:hypothetical protein
VSFSITSILFSSKFSLLISSFSSQELEFSIVSHELIFIFSFIISHELVFSSKIISHDCEFSSFLVEEFEVFSSINSHELDSSINNQVSVSVIDKELLFSSFNSQE